MRKLIYAAAGVLALSHPAASAQGERELMQRWLDSHCQANPASPECREAVVRKQPVARPGTFHSYPGPIDLCPPPQFRLIPGMVTLKSASTVPTDDEHVRVSRNEQQPRINPAERVRRSQQRCSVIGK
jgi:hypothetical protein